MAIYESGNAGILSRMFHDDLPLQKVAADITYIKHRGRWFFLVCFLDLFNNITHSRKLNGKPPVLFRIELVA